LILSIIPYVQIHFDSHYYLLPISRSLFFFFFNAPAPTEIYTLSLHDALPIYQRAGCREAGASRESKGIQGPQVPEHRPRRRRPRSEEHTSELQSLRHLVCRLLLEKKKKKIKK